jgi:DNA-binding CsgD family transcriptional regulator
MSAAAATSLVKLRGQPCRPLSEREEQITALFATGKGPQQIADILHLSVNTVNTHRVNAMRKLQIRTTIHLVHYALAHGLVQNKFQSGGFYGS